jgi:hypothetical protein
MSATIINIIIALIAGAVGGNAIGAELKNYDLSIIGNTIARGLGGGQALPAIALLAGAANVDAGSLIWQVIGGGIGGAIVTFLLGLIKSTMVDQPAK